MGWSNIEYLVAGFGLGTIVCYFWQSSRRNSNPSALPVADLQKDPVPLSQCSEQLQQVQLAYQMAASMSQLKAGFLARVAHELRSPLNGMIGMHQLILNGLCDTPEEEQEFIEKAHQSALKLMKFIDDIVVVSKTEHGTDKLEIQPVALAQVFQEVYSLTHHQAANRNLQFHLSEPPPDLYVLADQRRLRQVLVTLVDSAIVEMTEGSIRLSAKVLPESKCVQILLEDQRPESAWHEPIDLLTSPPPIDLDNFSGKFSAGMTLMVDKLLLELMQGNLEVMTIPQDTSSSFNQIQCTLPLVVMEVFE